MKILSALFLAFILVSCSETIDTQESELSSSLTVTTVHNSLEGGGRWFAGVDTGTWYDLRTMYTAKNRTSSTLTLTVKLEVGLLKNSKFESDNGEVFFDTSLDFKGTNVLTINIPPNSEKNIQWNIPVGIGRKLSISWNNPYATRLTITESSASDSIVIIDSLSGSNPRNRFTGILFTTEQSPDPIGLLDGPDDDDWKPFSLNEYKVSPAYPNPMVRSGTMTFVSRSVSDTMRVTLHRTLNDELMELLFISNLKLGSYPFIYDLSAYEIPFGQYRVYFELSHNGEKYLTHGDIMYAYP
jgi:hypothetical protein